MGMVTVDLEGASGSFRGDVAVLYLVVVTGLSARVNIHKGVHSKIVIHCM